VSVAQNPLLPGEPDPEVTSWLVETGRRRIARGLTHTPLAGTPPREAADPSGFARMRRIMLAVLLGISGTQYLYTDTSLEIVRLPSLIVFALR
jgi:hypothetical protein